ncbi:MAG: ADP compounds hydrolase NudE [Pseudomonadota bacterium]
MARVKPKITGVTEIARSRLFSLETVDLHFSNGSRAQYERARSQLIGGVLVVPVTDDGQVLLIREYQVGPDAYELVLPKGGIEAGEDALAAANRELQEEVGYAARSLELLKVMTLAPAMMSHRTHLVLATGLYPSRAQGDEHEPLEVVPWALDDWPALTARADFTEARSLAALVLAQQRLSTQDVRSA